jgi:hypothetical protein
MEAMGEAWRVIFGTTKAGKSRSRLCLYEVESPTFCTKIGLSTNLQVLSLTAAGPDLGFTILPRLEFFSRSLTIRW